MLAAVITASAVFIISALAAGAGFSGYERLKTAGFQFMEEFGKEDGVYSNGMFWADIALYINDEAFISMETAMFRDGERELARESTQYGPAVRNNPILSGSAQDDSTVSYTDKDVVYRWYNDGYFIERENSRRSYNGNSYTPGENFTPAQRQLIEAVADALIGDTRNYFISDGNIVSIALSGNQIPQIAQYAVAALAESAERDAIYDRGIANIFRIGADARFSNGSLVVELDDNNNVTGIRLDVEIVSTVNDKLQSFRITVEFFTKNIGTTTIPKPDGNAYGMPILPSYNDENAVVTFLYETAVA